MKMFSHIKLTNELKLLLLSTFGIIIILLYFALPHYYYGALLVQAQLQQPQQQLPPIISVKITSPVTNQVPIGQLTISGISTDNATSDCTVYADWNNTKPFQKAIATGPGGANDYSTWNFTYTDKYHLITNGTNDLTSKLSCLNNSSNGGGVPANITKNYSIIVIGIMGSSQSPASSAAVEGKQNNLSGSVSSSTLPPVKRYNNNTRTATTTTISPETIPSVPITPSPAPLSLPSIQEQLSGKDKVVVPNQEPQPQTAPANNADANFYWDIQ
jgi:hypothetical protein